MEGGEDEELDYDFNEEFQDDDDVNMPHRNEEEEEEQKRIEVGYTFFRSLQKLMSRNGSRRSSSWLMPMLGTDLRLRMTRIRMMIFSEKS